LDVLSLSRVYQKGTGPMVIKRDLLLKSIYILAAASLAALVFNTMGGIPLVGRREIDSDLILEEGLPEGEGLHLIAFEAARHFYENELGPIVDARYLEEYDRGHIPGALSCPFYELDQYLPLVLNKVPFNSRVMVYCNGEDCEDSRFLAGALQEAGYKKLYIYLGGYKEWLERGMPIVNEAETGPAHRGGFNPKKAFDFSGILPGWVWLSVDFLLLGYGLFILFLVAHKREDSLAAAFAVRMVGFLFLVAALHKIASPAEFARIIENYQILPGMLVNIAAIVMPWFEFSCGLLLLTGRLRAPSAAVILLMTGCFVLAIGFNIARGLDFDCGCFGSGHTSPWQVLLRDIGLFFCCLPALTGEKEPQKS